MGDIKGAHLSGLPGEPAGTFASLQGAAISKSAYHFD
jgi:hypothetical protein